MRHDDDRQFGSTRHCSEYQGDDEGALRELCVDREHGRITEASEAELDSWLAGRSRENARLRI